MGYFNLRAYFIERADGDAEKIFKLLYRPTRCFLTYI